MPEAWLAALASLADEGEWGIEDVVTSFKSSREKFELWEAIVEAAAERLEVASGVRPNAIQMKRALLYVTWFDGKADMSHHYDENQLRRRISHCLSIHSVHHCL